MILIRKGRRERGRESINLPSMFFKGRREGERKRVK
jgi:hypothetical protein